MVTWTAANIRRHHMLPYEQALQTLLERVPEPEVAGVRLAESQGRVLAKTIHADLDLPPFNKSFVDGYACRSEDIRSVPARLEVIGVVAAGSPAQPRVGPGQAVQIMTGAPVPPGADAVQMVENCRTEAGYVHILAPVSEGQNISLQGDEVKRGTPVVECGRVITPAVIGVLATFGQTWVKVYAAPKVAVFSTGDEIVDVEEKPTSGKIRNSNSYMLWAQCRSLGLEAEIFPVVRDHPEAVGVALVSSRDKNLVLFSGGVSMGEYDYVHKVLGELGIEVFFHKVAVKPGKPVLVGRKDKQMIFGLPGNPVSSFTTFELFVSPAVRKWMGFRDTTLRRVTGVLLRDVEQKPGRMFFKPAHTFFTEEGYKVEPIETKGSADLVAFSRADSFLVMGAEVSRIPAGARVQVLLLPSC